MVPRATTPCDRSLDKFCSGYVSLVLKGLMRLCTGMGWFSWFHFPCINSSICKFHKQVLSKQKEYCVEA